MDSITISQVNTAVNAFDVTDSFQHGTADAASHAGLDMSSGHRAEFWKQFALANGIGTAKALMNTFTRAQFRNGAAYNNLRAAYTRGVREARTIVSLRINRETEEAAAQVRERNTERNAERNRKKREAKKRLRTTRPTAARPAPVQ
jgi:hypothetical protein